MFTRVKGISPTKHYNIQNTYYIDHANNFFECIENKIREENLRFAYQWIVLSMNSLLYHT